MAKLTTLIQMRALAERAENRSAEIAALAAEAAKAEFISASIPVSAWAANADETLFSEGYAYMADVAVEGITAADGAGTEIAKTSRAAAKSCELAGISETAEGTIRYYAKAIPSAALSIEILVLRA